jgi:hypothetical protein
VIPIVPVGEPADFNKKVRVPGSAFLRKTPHPGNAEWRRNGYWRMALHDLFNAYKGICAYSASWTKRATATAAQLDWSVDHYVPRSAMPSLAYEWDNFRLCRGRLNARKGSHRDVLDPFTLAIGWFRLDFQTFLLVPDANLPAADKALVSATIARLALNTDNDYVNERIGAIRQYCLGNATFTQLAVRYPFIAAEMIDQDFDTNFLPRLHSFFSGAR